MVTAGGALLPKTGIPEFLGLNGSIAIKLLNVCLQRMIKRSLGLGYSLYISFSSGMFEKGDLNSHLIFTSEGN